VSEQRSQAGWFPDPLARFEFRYFNGETWTQDVSVNGQRFVDPVNPSAPPGGYYGQRPRRGVAVASMVLGIVAVVVGWIPFVTVAGGVCAILALILGAVGLQQSKRNNGHGRGFALTGLLLGGFGALVTALGVWLTVLSMREVTEYENPGRHELVVAPGSCVVENGLASVSGTITNLESTEQSFSIRVEFFAPEARGSAEDRIVEVVEVNDVEPQDEVEWSASTFISGDRVECDVLEVKGPPPFGVSED
jgi:hypothetical protein